MPETWGLENILLSYLIMNRFVTITALSPTLIDTPAWCKIHCSANVVRLHL